MENSFSQRDLFFDKIKQNKCDLFSFVLQDRKICSSELPCEIRNTQKEKNKEIVEIQWNLANTGLTLTLQFHIFADFPYLEYESFLHNPGTVNSPVIDDLKMLDLNGEIKTPYYGNMILQGLNFSNAGCRIKVSYYEDEIAAEAMGVGLFKHKCMAFMISAFFAGIGGGLYATLLGTVDPKNFLFTLTYNFLLIIVLGGMGSITGSMLGSIIVTAGLEYLRVFDEPLELFGMAIPLFRPGFRMVIFSVLLMACVLFWRKGIMGTNEFTWEKFMAFCKNPVKYFTQKGAK